MNQKLKVAILGSGNIGADLLIKILRSPWLECTLFIGRNPASPGLARARSLGVPVSADGIQVGPEHREKAVAGALKAASDLSAA